MSGRSLEKAVAGQRSAPAKESRLCQEVLERQICRITYPDPGDDTKYDHGTGFLVGPSAVLTAYHVIRLVHEGKVDPGSVKLTFDSVPSHFGSPERGTTFQLDGNWWLVDKRPGSGWDEPDLFPDASPPKADELDYALLHVAGEPGHQRLEGAPVPTRGWIYLPEEDCEITVGSRLWILHYPPGQVMQRDIGRVIKVDPFRVRYRIDTTGGSSGSPCFDEDWALVAIHTSTDPFHDLVEWNQGVPISAIRNAVEHGPGKRFLGHRLALPPRDRDRAKEPNGCQNSATALADAIHDWLNRPSSTIDKDPAERLKLTPLDFTTYVLEKLQDFVGREELLGQIDAWRISTTRERGLLILAAPGMGKSTLIARLVHLNPGGQVLSLPFLSYR